MRKPLREFAIITSMSKPGEYQLLNNSRFYILASTVLFSVAVAAWLRLQISTDQLYYIRLQQAYGLLCMLYWYVALVISPLGYVIGKQRMGYIEFARRAIGVSAAYFAVLHMLVALLGQLGGINEIALLPSLFKWSLLGGFIAVIVLLLLAATSFDTVIKYMTFPRWKWLHRLVYGAGILAVLHVWTIGTHVAYSGVQIMAFVALALLSGLETFRVTTLLARKHSELQSRGSFTLFFVSVWSFWLVLVLALPTMVQNYHNRHTESGHNHSTQGKTQ
jgi:methionine sulfoxide reductase heme-binding subunit